MNQVLDAISGVSAANSTTDVDATFSVLNDPRRRIVLQTLDADDPPIAIADLARDVAATERGVDPEAVSGDAVEAVYLSLFHHHVPKLADLGFLETEERTVSPTEDAERLGPVLDRLSRGPNSSQ